MIPEDRASIAMCDFTEALSELSQAQKYWFMEQVILDLMDYTEQTDDEKMWCDLLDALRALDKKYYEVPTQLYLNLKEINKQNETPHFAITESLVVPWHGTCSVEMPITGGLTNDPRWGGVFQSANHPICKTTNNLWQKGI